MTIKVKSTIIQILWLLLTGGVLTIITCYGAGINLVKQSIENLSKVGAQTFSLQVASLSLLREFGPVTAGFNLAKLAPIIGILAYLGIKKVDIEDAEKSKLLISSKFISLIVVTLILTILGTITGIISALRESTANLRILFDFLSIGDVLISVIKGVLFGTALAVVGIFQVKQFFKRPKVIPIILTAILTIILGVVAITLLDVGITGLFYFIFKI